MNLDPAALAERLEQHVSQSLAILDERMREHDATARCTRSLDCNYCALLALSIAMTRRVLDFVTADVVKR